MTDTTNALVDEVIAAAENAASSAATEHNVDNTASENQQTDEQQAENKQPELTEEQKEHRKLQNALKRAQKHNYRKDFELEQIKAELERLRSSNPNPQAKASDAAPSMDDFQSYDEYVRAMVKWETKSATAEGHKAFQEQQKNVQRQQWVDHQDQAISAEVERIVASEPDAQRLIQENAEIIDSFTPALNMVAYQLQASGMNPVAGCLQLAKEGKLETLLTVHPNVAAGLMIAAAERAQASPAKPKQPTNAPKPMAPVSGAKGGMRGVEQMNGKELMNWLNS